MAIDISFHPMTRRLAQMLVYISAPGWLGHGLAFLAGLLFAFGFAPYHLWPISIISLMLYALGHRQLTPKQACARGFWFGLGQFGHGVSWVYVSVHDYAYLSVPLAASLTLAFVAIFACFTMLQSYCYVKLRLNQSVILGLPTIWVLFEWARLWLFTGFPWLYLGYVFTGTFLANAWAPLLGVLGLSFFSALIASLLVMCVQSLSWEITRRYLGLLFLLLGATIGLSFIPWTAIDQHRSPLNIVLVQGNISQDLKWLAENRLPTLKKYYALSQKALLAPIKPDLIVWPEAAIPTFYQESWGYIDQVDILMSTYKAIWVFGISSFHPKQNHFEFNNSIVALGAGQGIYHKQKLVPFGEYFPLSQWFGKWLPFLNIPMSGFAPGPEAQFPLMGQGVRFAPFICYEILYPDFVRHYAQGNDFLLTISNDAWFGHSIAADQHFEMARMRAIENGKYLIRSTNTGITGIVDFRGRVVAQAPSFVTTTLTGRVYFTQGRTPFSHWGQLPILLGCFVLLLIFIMQEKKRPTSSENK